MPITVARHGSTDLNELGCLRGWLNVPLSPLGRAQALVLAQGLAGRNFDAIYTSDLSRAVDTANAINAYYPGLAIQWAPELRPINFGDLQGRPYAEIKEDLDALWLKWEQDPTVRAPNGESFWEFQDRLLPFIKAKSAEHANPLFVTHTRTCSYVLAYTLNSCKMLFPEHIGLMKKAEVNCANVAAVRDETITELNTIKQLESI